MKWLKDNIIYLTIAGSRSYGMATDLSDLDIKGIVIPPKEIEYNLFHKFEQSENNSDIENIVNHLKNPKNPKVESTIYSLKKFFILAAEVNPNIIELLFTNEKHHIITTPIFKYLIENRHLFISNKARYTFSGYSADQLKKIERHRKWIVMGELKFPTREDFGLPPTPINGLDDVLKYIKSTVESWNLNQFSIDEMERSELKNIIWELMSNVIGKEISISNWPTVYSDAVIYKISTEFNLKEDLVKYIYAERCYNKAKQNYDSWISWKNERNPDRRRLEIQSGYDTKHAAMLVRLLRVGYEIITEGKVIVDRTGRDADELLAIKNGAWSFEKVMEYKEEMEKKLDVEYERHKKLVAEGKPTPIPREVNKEKLNELYHELYNLYW